MIVLRYFWLFIILAIAGLSACDLDNSHDDQKSQTVENIDNDYLKIDKHSDGSFSYEIRKKLKSRSL